MRLLLSSLAVLSCLSVLILAEGLTLKGQIAFNDILPHTSLPPSSRVSLNYARSTLVRQDGSFELTGVDEGEHVLETTVPGYMFAPLLITITNTTSPNPSGPSDASNAASTPFPSEPTTHVHVQVHHPARLPLPPTSSTLPNNPIVLQPLLKEDYYTSANGVNVLGLLKNPMVLMMAFSGVMMFAMPKLIASVGDMDPELAKEMADSRKKMQGIQNMDWTGSLSNMLAGSAEDSVPAPTAPAPARGTTPVGGGGGGKKCRGR